MACIGGDCRKIAERIQLNEAINSLKIDQSGLTDAQTGEVEFSGVGGSVEMKR